MTVETVELPAQRTHHPAWIGPYRILSILGRGGMGTVYRAQVVVSCQVPIGQLVALKLLRETSESECRRFARESSYLQALRHPGIVRVLDTGEYEGHPYLVMQLVEGQHADDLIGVGTPLDQLRVTEIAIQALDALHFAHRSGILHRDVKPGNIMITAAGQVKLVDFGLAQYIDAESHLTATGAVVGTPAYMSPEQAYGRREEINFHSDIYSMGACLYELLTGKQPFVADNSVALLRRIIEEPLVPPSRLRPDLSRDLETIVLKAMAKDARDRYSSAEAMAADLRRFRLGMRVRTARPSALVPLLRAAWRRRRALAATGLVLFVAATLAALAVRHSLNQARARLAPAAPTGVQPATWVDEWRQGGALDAPTSGAKFRPYPILGRNLQLALLPTVAGPVRLGALVELLEDDCLVELMVCDRDVGRGYRLRLEGGKDGDRLALLRENKVVASRELGRLPRRQALRLRLQRLEETVTASLGNGDPLKFLDLIPIEGPDADAVFIAFVPGQLRITDVQLERQRSEPFVSALSQADSLRQNGQYARAMQRYETFLRDNPTSPQARDARLRIALCLEALGDDEQALAKYIEVASANRDDSRYLLTATFHAWSCALRLGRYQVAEEYFESIRRDYDLATLLIAVPQSTVEELVRDYFSRAERLGAGEPDRVLRLYTTAADFATYLNLPQAVAEAQSNAGDVLMSMGRIGEALERYRGVAGNAALPAPERTKALLKVAEAERQRDHLEAAEIAYQMILDQPAAAGDHAPWARLWLGDIYAQRGDLAEALECWKRSADATGLAGQIMQNLVTGQEPLALPLATDRFHANDTEYFNARLALLRGHPDQYRERLENVVRMGPPNDWPAPFAQHLLQQLAAGQTGLPPPDAGDAPTTPETPAPERPEREKP
jgi:tetratricopeptide (TPR) repeat protein